MKIILSIIFMILSIQASELVVSNTCKACHPTIYSEFYDSSHRKASIFENKVHKGMWDLHPDKQKESYSCAKCHKLYEPKDFTKEDWKPILVRMQKKAKLDDVKMASITNYIHSQL